MPASLAALREFKHLEGRRVGAGLNLDEFERWMRLKLELDAMQSGASNRRRSFRVPTRLLCSLKHRDDQRRTMISNFSDRGAFIQTRAPLPENARLQLSLDVSGEEPIEVEAIVVSTRIDLQSDPSEHGMGIRFTNVDDPTKARLARFYQNLCVNSTLPETAVAT